MSESLPFRFNKIRFQSGWRDSEKELRASNRLWSDYFRKGAIERQKYYEGFNVGREKKMFQEELKDLEIIYKRDLIQLQRKVENCLPALLYYMEEFLNLHKQNEEVREKLDVLFEKTGREIQEDGEDDE
jgi:hypothetical protein